MAEAQLIDSDDKPLSEKLREMEEALAKLSVDKEKKKLAFDDEAEIIEISPRKSGKTVVADTSTTGAVTFTALRVEDACCKACQKTGILHEAELVNPQVCDTEQPGNELPPPRNEKTHQSLTAFTALVTSQQTSHYLSAGKSQALNPKPQTLNAKTLRP